MAAHHIQSHPITGMHPQPGCAEAQGHSQTPVCLRSQRTPFLSLRPPTILHTTLQQNDGYSLATSQTMPASSMG